MMAETATRAAGDMFREDEAATMPAIVTKMLEAKPRYGLTTSTLWMAYIGNR